MRTNIYLRFDGHCEEAFKFYAELCGGAIESLSRYGDSPAEDQVPPELRNKVLHARVRLGDHIFMGSDAPPGRYQKPDGFSVSLSVDTVADAERIYKGLSAGGDVVMPMTETFFAECFAMFNDRFGTPWMVICDKPHA